MSFYGNVTYYLSNAFKQIIYENQTSDVTMAPQVVGQKYTLIPAGRDDSTTLKAYNKWVKFGTDSQNYADNKVYIYHALNGINQQVILNPNCVNLNSDEISNYEGEEILEPQFNSIITIPQVTFDEAGHFIDGKMKNFLLPNPPGTEDINDLKLRLATLENKLEGQWGTPGKDVSGNEIHLDAITNNYSARLLKAESKIADWPLMLNPNASVPEGDDNYREKKGIGSTLRDLMVTVGLRAQVKDPITGETRTVTTDGVTTPAYVVVTAENRQTLASDSILNKVEQAFNWSNSTSESVTILRRLLRQMLETMEVNDAGSGDGYTIFSQQDYEYYKSQLASTT